MKNFKKMKVWEMGVQIALDCFNLVKTFPKEERFGLSSQITRAAISIPSNIAEGSSRTSEKDYCRYIEISLGSSFELETHLIISSELNYGDALLRNELLQKIVQEIMMLHKLIQCLRTS